MKEGGSGREISVGGRKSEIVKGWGGGMGGDGRMKTLGGCLRGGEWKGGKGREERKGRIALLDGSWNGME